MFSTDTDSDRELTVSVSTHRLPEALLADATLRSETLATFARYARCYYTSLPRVLEHAVDGDVLHVAQPALAGEKLEHYLNRLGPIVLETSCALVWRLASELAHAVRIFPDLAGWLDFAEARVVSWHRDCLLLTLPCFSARLSKGGDAVEGENRLVKELIKLLGRLVSGGRAQELPNHLASRLPMDILQFLQPSPDGIRTTSGGHPLAEFQRLMNQGLALFTRRKEIGSLAGLFHVPIRLLPNHDGVVPYTPPAASDLFPEGGRMAVSLVHLLMHRSYLGTSEVAVLRRAIEQSLPKAAAQKVFLDPQNIYLQFSLNGGSLDSRKDLLDTRLQSDTGLKAIIHTPGDAFDPLQSPVMVSPARQAGQPFVLHTQDYHRQFSKLFDLLRSGCYALNAFGRESTMQKVRVANSRRARLGAAGAAQEKRISILQSLEPQSPPPATESVATATEPAAQAPAPAPIPTPSPAFVAESPASPESAVSPLAQVAQVEKISVPRPLIDDPTPMDHPTPNSDSPSSNRLVITTVGSGGIGKSTIARLIYELADLQSSDSVALFDCDATGNRDFQRVAPDRVEASPVHDVETIRKMISCALEKSLVIADLPASCHDAVLRDLNPEVIRDLREEDHIEWLPIFPITAKASTIPTIHQWRKLIFGDAAALLVVNLKDGPVTNEMIESVRQPQDTVVRMPLLDSALAAALDAVGGIWSDISEGRTVHDQKLFNNPLVRRQLRTKLREMEASFAPLLTRIKALLPQA